MAGDREPTGATGYEYDEERDEREVEEEAEENRKETLLASSPSLQPNFKRSSVTHQQILKLQELHKRRMQIKAKSKIHKKSKADGKKPGFKSPGSGTSGDGHVSVIPKDSSSSDFQMSNMSGRSSTGVDNKAVYQLPKKLHWGLEPKERWERKANM